MVKVLTLKKIFLFFLASSFLLLSFFPENVPGSFAPAQIVELAKDNDVVILFNSGGWGNTPLERAIDFGSVIRGIQATLNSWGHDSIVVSYYRTVNSLGGKVAGLRDFFSSFRFSSAFLAREVEILVEKLPDKKIILVGLSAGGALVDETYSLISKKAKNSVIAIAAGIPFWVDDSSSGGILYLDNNGRDKLAAGKVENLFAALIVSPLEWLVAKISGQNVSLIAVRNQIIGHFYDWSLTAPQIVPFLEKNIVRLQ
jgi:pimeloyl-ACP methyl ester carboxylesterase